MSNKSTEEVFLDLVHDFHKRRLKYSDVAAATGYNSRTMYNIMAGRTKYMPPVQAKKFADAFGYNIEYLMCGKGELYPAKEVPPSPSPAPSSENDIRKQLLLLMSIFNRYMMLRDDSLLKSLYQQYLLYQQETDGRKALEIVNTIDNLFSNGVDSVDPLFRKTED